MKLTLHFYQINSDFSPEYAAANHGGKESENNVHYEWEDEMEVSSDLKNVNIKRNADLPLRLQYENGKIVEEIVNNMFLIELQLADNKVGYLGVSECMFIDFEESGTKEDLILKIFLKDYEPFWNEMPGVYIASKEFPKNIRLNDRD